MNAFGLYNSAQHWRNRLATRVLRSSFERFGDGSLLLLPFEAVNGVARIRVGARVWIGPNSSMWTSHRGRIEIGDGCRFTAGARFSAEQEIVLGRAVLLAANVQVLDNQHATADPSRPILEQKLDRVAPVRIDDGAWLGANVVVMPGVRIGRNAVVGANAVVTRDVADYAVVAGVPAKVIGSSA
jgi:acetyltransferase-like isoleucine patch superfamily enzyme